MLHGEQLNNTAVVNQPWFVGHHQVVCTMLSYAGDNDHLKENGQATLEMKRYFMIKVNSDGANGVIIVNLPEFREG